MRISPAPEAGRGRASKKNMIGALRAFGGSPFPWGWVVADGRPGRWQGRGELLQRGLLVGSRLFSHVGPVLVRRRPAQRPQWLCHEHDGGQRHPGCLSAFDSQRAALLSPLLLAFRFASPCLAVVAISHAWPRSGPVGSCLFRPVCSVLSVPSCLFRPTGRAFQRPHTSPTSISRPKKPFSCKFPVRARSAAKRPTAAKRLDTLPSDELTC